MIANFNPSRLSGKVKAPQSKSIAIRLLFSSLLGKINLEGLEFSDDVMAAVRAIEALGVKHNKNIFEPGDVPTDIGKVDLGGSGTVLRMLIPVLACVGISASLSGDDTLQKRPLGVLYDLLLAEGLEMTGDHLPLKISGRLKTQEITISGGESSQYISGFIFGLLLTGGGMITLEPPVRSSSYIQMTCDLLNSIGAAIKYSGNRIKIEPMNGELAYSGPVPGDFLLSSLYAAGAVLTGGKVEISNLIHPEWSMGDSRIAEILKRCSGGGSLSDGIWTAYSDGGITPFRESVEDSPDMAVSLAAIAAGSPGESEISGIELLGIKESNRVLSIRDTLERHGCKVGTGRVMTIKGTDKPGTGKTQSWNDHRIVMLGSILSLRAGGRVEGAESVSKSNPRFFDDLRKLGGDFTLT